MDELIEYCDVEILILESAVDAKNDLEGTSTQDISGAPGTKGINL